MKFQVYNLCLMPGSPWMWCVFIVGSEDPHTQKKKKAESGGQI